MKTIEEREDNFAKRELPHNNGTALWRDGYREGLKVGYHFGATEQKAIDIDKAWSILKELIDGSAYDGYCETRVITQEQFREEMGE